MRPTIHDILITRSLVLVDGEDVPRAILHQVKEKEGVCLELHDTDRIARLQLSLDAGGNPSVLFLEKDGSVAISISRSPESRRGLEINSPTNGPAIYIGVHSDGARHIEILDEGCQSQWRAP